MAIDDSDLIRIFICIPAAVFIIAGIIERFRKIKGAGYKIGLGIFLFIAAGFIM